MLRLDAAILFICSLTRVEPRIATLLRDSFRALGIVVAPSLTPDSYTQALSEPAPALGWRVVTFWKMRLEEGDLRGIDLRFLKKRHSH